MEIARKDFKMSVISAQGLKGKCKPNEKRDF